MSKKVNWAEMDKRVRGRRPSWSKDELEALETGLNKLPDLAEQCEIIDVHQPGVGKPQLAEEGDDGEAPN